MAQKRTTKKKAAKKAAKKATRKAATKKSRAGAVGGAPAGGPIQSISTGSGRSAAEVGADLVNMFNERAKDETIWDRLFARDFTSIEGHGVNMMFRGRHAIEAKAQEWNAKHIVHGAKAEGPFVGSTGFAVRFTVDTEDRQTGARQTMREVGVYTVQDGKVIQEEFMYGG